MRLSYSQSLHPLLITFMIEQISLPVLCALPFAYIAGNKLLSTPASGPLPLLAAHLESC